MNWWKLSYLRLPRNFPLFLKTSVLGTVVSSLILFFPIRYTAALQFGCDYPFCQFHSVGPNLTIPVFFPLPELVSTWHQSITIKKLKIFVRCFFSSCIWREKREAQVTVSSHLTTMRDVCLKTKLIQRRRERSLSENNEARALTEPCLTPVSFKQCVAIWLICLGQFSLHQLS